MLLPQGAASRLSRTCQDVPQHPKAPQGRVSTEIQPQMPPVLTAGLPVGAGLDEEDIEGRWQVPGCLVLLVRLVEGHEEVLLHGQGGLGDTGMGFRSGDGTE